MKKDPRQSTEDQGESIMTKNRTCFAEAVFFKGKQIFDDRFFFGNSFVMAVEKLSVWMIHGAAKRSFAPC